MTLIRNITNTPSDGSLDAFSRQRVSSPTNVFDCQFTYGLQPLVFEQITSGAGATITHDATNRNALMTFSATPTGGKCYMQSYEYHRYQPLKSQLIAVTFNFVSSSTTATKFAGYSDRSNGIEFQNFNNINQFTIYSTTTNGNETVVQNSWNLDKLNGTGLSGLLLDITKPQILIIDFQALYLGRVRVGFDINGQVIYCHEFNHANNDLYPYIADANLPIICGMVSTGTTTTTMNFQCSAVASEGGSEETVSYDFVQESTLTAGNGTPTHALALRPKTTFNSFTNRTKVGFIEIDILVTGSNSVMWELSIGQAISGTTTFTDVNTTYSSMEYNTAGTLSGTPALIINKGYCGASNTIKGVLSNSINSRYPITLDSVGLHRILGTLNLAVTGIGGTSAVRVSLKWKEIR